MFWKSLRQVDLLEGFCNLRGGAAAAVGRRNRIVRMEPAREDGAEHAELADWRAVHATNLDGVFLGCKHGIRAMRSSGTGSTFKVLCTVPTHGSFEPGVDSH